MKRNLYLCLAAALPVLIAVGVTARAKKAKPAGSGDTVKAPMFEVDPWWPKPLPNHWIAGSTIGVSVDKQDNVWTLQRPNTVEDNFKAADLHVGVCCVTQPPIVAYHPDGSYWKSWGDAPGHVGAGYVWPDTNHGLLSDSKGNIWFAGAGNNDTNVLKFSADGKFLLQIGTHGVHHGSNDPENFWQPTKIFEVPADNEVYISDGYGNKRVIVFDEDTGKFKRLWGAYGKPPVDPPPPPPRAAGAPRAAGEQEAAATGDPNQSPNRGPNGEPPSQFNTMHCVIVSNDGMVYACDRVNDRIQVFHKDGTFVKEVFIEPRTRRSGSVWDMAFSKDPAQTYILSPNGVNEHINILNRDTLEVLTSIGDGGRHPGQFFGCHNIALDSHGNMFITETYDGARVQKFVFKGIGNVKRGDQGTTGFWPKKES